MKKYDIIRAVTEKTGVSADVASRVVDSFFNVVAEAMKAGERIELRGFGVFKSVVSPERPAHDFRTGNMISLPERRVPKFKFSKEFLEKMKEEA